jgi:hypothetical protein
MPRAYRPVLKAFLLDTDLPSGVRGPVECWALRRLASICFWDDMESLVSFGHNLPGELRGDGG